MTTILRIEGSSRPAGSMTEGWLFTRTIADHLVGWLRADHPNAKVVTRDLAKDPSTHIAAETMTGHYTEPAQMTP